MVEYNREEIERLLKKYRPQVLCTSRFVEKEFKKDVPGLYSGGCAALTFAAVFCDDDRAEGGGL